MDLHICYGWLWLVIVGVAVAQTIDPDNHFLFPSPMDFDHEHVGGSFEVGSLLSMSWTTDWQEATLVIFQDGPDPFQYIPNGKSLLQSDFVWPVDISGIGQAPKFDLSKGALFFLGVFHTGTSDIFQCQYFNITEKQIQPPSSSEKTTLTPSTSVATSSTHISTTPATSTSPAGEAQGAASGISGHTPSPTAPSNSHSLSTGDKTRIGVGVTIGVLAIAAISGIGLFLWKRKVSTARAAVVAASQPPQFEAPFDPRQPVELPSSPKGVSVEKYARPVHPVYEM